MVDFNNEATIGTPAVDIIRVLILEKRNFLIESIEHYHKIVNRGSEADDSVVKARAYTLWLEISALLKRKNNKEEHQQLKKLLTQGSIQDVIDGLVLINDLLDSIRLTRIDTRADIHPNKFEEYNATKGLT